MPVRHYTPLPFILLCLLVEDWMRRGETEVALMTWLAYHCLLRPSGPLLARVSDPALPATLSDILQGEKGYVQVRNSKRVKGTRLAGLNGILRPRQVVIFDRALMVLLWAFANVQSGGWWDWLTHMAEKFWVHDFQIVPRSLGPGGACYLHMEYGWPSPDLVNRGGWAGLEATHSYLNTGVYATVAPSMVD